MSSPFVVMKQGGEFLVNSVTQQQQIYQTITNLTNGGFVVSWQDGSGQGGDTSFQGIKAQIYGATGAKVGGEFLVNTTTSDSQLTPAITGLASGGFVVSWDDFSRQGGDSSSYAVKAQIYDATGARVGTEFLVNTTTQNAQQSSTITSLTNGGFVVSWQDFSGIGGDSTAGVKAQIYSATGTRVGTEFLVNTVTQGQQSSPAITGLMNGGFIVSWTDGSRQGEDSSETGVKAQIYDPTGARVGTEFLVNTTTAGFQGVPSVASLTGGGFVLAWEDDNNQLNDSNRRNIKAQIYDVTGSRVGSEFLVNTITRQFQSNPTVSGLQNGGFVISWSDSGISSTDRNGFDVKAQAYDAAGARIGGEFLVNTTTQSNQSNPTIAGLNDGSFVVSWLDGSGQGGDTSGGSIKAQIFGVYNNIVGGEGVKDQLVGTAGRDRLTGLSGSDRLDGGAGADLLIGGLGNDTYVVDNAGDVVVELAGEGTDRVLSQVSYTLGDNVENLGLGTSASLSGTGNELDNLILGNVGANVLDGRSGADTLTGGAGRDTFVLRAGETQGDTVTDFVRGTDTLAFYGFGTDAVLSHASGSDLYTVTSGDGLASGSFRLTGVSDLDLAAGAANTDARFFA